jgi:hypothetical protein
MALGVHGLETSGNLIDAKVDEAGQIGFQIGIEKISWSRTRAPCHLTMVGFPRALPTPYKRFSPHIGAPTDLQAILSSVHDETPDGTLCKALLLSALGPYPIELLQTVSFWLSS